VNEDVYVGQNMDSSCESLCLQFIGERPKFVEIERPRGRRFVPVV
jgi:hypothetical protein